MGRHGFSLVTQGMVLVAGPRLNGAVAKSMGDWAVLGSVARAMVSKHSTCKWSCLTKMALLSLGLHQGFTTIWLNPKAPTKVLLLMDGYQIIVSVRGYKQGNSYFVILLTSPPGLLICILRNRKQPYLIQWIFLPSVNNRYKHVEILVKKIEG